MNADLVREFLDAVADYSVASAIADPLMSDPNEPAARAERALTEIVDQRITERSQHR